MFRKGSLVNSILWKEKCRAISNISKFKDSLLYQGIKTCFSVRIMLHFFQSFSVFCNKLLLNSSILWNKGRNWSKNGWICQKGFSPRLWSSKKAEYNLYNYIILKYVEVSRDSQLNYRLCQYISKRSKNMSPLPYRATPDANCVLEKGKMSSHWFHSQEVTVPKLTSDILHTNVTGDLMFSDLRWNGTDDLMLHW